MNTPANENTAANALWFGNTAVTIKLSASEGRDGICIMEHRMPYGESPPLHLHRDEDEIFHILEGTIRFHVNGTDRVARAGETVLAPKCLPHSFFVESKDGARCLTVTRGHAFESVVRTVSRPAEADELPPPAVPTAEMIEALVRRCAENGVDIVGAPLS